MYKHMKSFVTILTFLIVLSPSLVLSQTRERSEVPTEHKWKLEDLYETDQAWNEAKEKLVARFDEVEKYRGRLSESASELLACLEFNSDISKEFGRLFSYASMKSDEDLRDSKYLAMKDTSNILVPQEIKNSN